MTINDILNKKNISTYRLSKDSGVPYSTLADIVSGKTSLEKCSAETVFKLAKALDVTMEELVGPYMDRPVDFELFRSNICHRVKEMGDLDFIMDLLVNNTIWEYYTNKRYTESLYLLGMLDYLSRVNDLPQCTEYDELRKRRFEDPIYPSGVLIKADIMEDDSIITKAYEESIPEFRAFNIIEGDIRNVI